MNDFIIRVRKFIREYVPEENLVDYEEIIEDVDKLEKTLDKMMAKPKRENLSLVRGVAYDFALHKLDEYRTSQQIVSTVSAAFASVIEDHLAEIRAIETVNLTDESGRVSYRRKGITPEEYKTEKESLVERARKSNVAKKLIYNNDIGPLKIVFNRCKVFVKALSQRAMVEFPAPVQKAGWFPDKPISDSSDPNKDPLTSSINHEVADLFAKQKLQSFSDLLKQLETGKTQAEQRAEAKRIFEESGKASAERMENLMALRAAKKADLDQKVEAMK